MSAAEHFSQANALMGQRRFAEAEQAYRQALQLQPGFAEAWLNLGVALKSQGRLSDAEASCRQALQTRPAFVEALNNLGNILLAQGRHAEAESAYRHALALRPEHLEALLNLARIQLAGGRIAEAEACSRRALALRPDMPETHNSLGLCRQAQGSLTDAEACFRQALEQRPGHPDALNHLGNLFQQQGQYAAAEPVYRQALISRPGFAEAHNNLGNSLQEQGRYLDAETSYRQALAINPGYVEAHGHLGAALKAQGRLVDAAAAYRRALELRPDDVVALNNLAQLLIIQGSAGPALELILRALAHEDRPESRLLFMDCITRCQITHQDAAVRRIMIRALSVPWGQAGALARVGVAMAKIGLGEAGADVESQVLAAASDELLLALMCSTQLRDPELEQFLTQVRRQLLEIASSGGNLPGAPAPGDEVLRFFSALAQQCFINEYVMFVSDDEARRVADLHADVAADLVAGRQIAIIKLLALATYLPLCALESAERLLDRPGSKDIGEVLRQQIREPLRERTLARDMARLTPIDDAVSLRVQQQYVENPFPRWMSPEIFVSPKGVNEYLRACFPRVVFLPLNITGPLAHMVAGCGTGYQPIGAARRFRNVKVLAIDLSLPSLCYAKRKAEEMGLSNIEFAQADILKLGNIGQTFDVIESAGVLHHLASIDQGLRILVSLLRPDGFLQLGLYSRIARRNITRARAYIAERGAGATPDDIRRSRKALTEIDGDEDLRSVSRLSDFFGTSTCRDLLFHVQETCIDLRQLKALLAGNGLRFLGFDLDAQVKNAYLQRYPDDAAAIELDNWHQFEQDNPDIFIGMYQFWTQKAR